MANTYTTLHYHFIFSTKNRVAWLTSEISPRVWAYLGGVARHHKMTALQIGGFEDHIHALVKASTTIAPCQIAQYLKGDSSRWIHETFHELRDFAWQEGYGAFTVSPSQVESVAEYIRNQQVHHQQRGFQDEYRDILRKHDIEFDERYVWG